MGQSAVVHVLAISGSLRRASVNRAVIAAAAQIAPGGLDVVAYEDLAAIPPFNPDIEDEATPAAVRALRRAIEVSEAVLISSPEYAHGVPGVLKNALDWLVASGEFIDKPVAVINASSRASHARASLVETLTTMSAQVVPDASITLPLDGRRPDVESIVGDASATRALRAALDALVAAAQCKREAPR